MLFFVRKNNYNNEKGLCKTTAKSLRKDRDSNPGNAFDVYTLSRRASSTTRASFLFFGLQKYAFFLIYNILFAFHRKYFLLIHFNILITKDIFLQHFTPVFLQKRL